MNGDMFMNNNSRTISSLLIVTWLSEIPVVWSYDILIFL